MELDNESEKDVISSKIVDIIKRGDSFLLESVLNYYINLLDYEDLNKNTWLHHAASSGNWGIVDLLCKKGLDVNAYNLETLTPVDYAVANRYTQCLEVLINNGAKLENGFKTSVFNNYANGIELFLNNGIDPNMKIIGEMRALEIAIRNESHQSIELLIKNGASLNEKFSSGGTILENINNKEILKFVKSFTDEYNSSTIKNIKEVLQEKRDSEIKTEVRSEIKRGRGRPKLN